MRNFDNIDLWQSKAYTLSMFASSFTSVATLIFIGVVGFAAAYRKMLHKDVLGFLSPLALEIALPAMIFSDILTKFNPSEDTSWYIIPLYWAGFTLFAFVFSLISMLLANRKFRSEMGITMMYQNAIFFPLAIISSMYGPSSPLLVQLFLFTFVYAAFIFNTAGFFFKSRLTAVDLGKIFHPTLIATLLAVSLKLLGWGSIVPSFITNALRMVGSMSVPLLMIILGGNIYIDFKNRGRFHLLETAKFVLIKNFLMPLAAIFILRLLRLPQGIGFIILLQSAVPPITAIPILTERNGGNREIVNQFIVASFIFSLVSIPLMIYLYEII